MKKINIDKKILKDLYVNKKMSQKECSKIFNCCYQIIFKNLQNYNIPIRCSNKHITKDILFDLYINKKFSTKKIADIFKCASHTITANLKKYNIPNRNTHVGKCNLVKENLIDLYINKNLNLDECGNILRCSSKTVKNYLVKYDIPIVIKRKKRIHITKEQIEDLYIKKEYTIQECADKLNCCRDLVLYRMKDYGIKSRNMDKKILDKDIMYKLYIQENLKRKECADIMNCSVNTFWKYMKIYKIKKKVISNESRKKMRISRIKYLKSCLDTQIHPVYNKQASIFFEKLNKWYGLKGRHAENGGEYFIKGLHYWVDYYEPNLNLVIEWDENRHYKNGQLKEKDIRRQNEIEKHLGCRFLRIREDQINLLEINGAIRYALLT